MLHVGGVFDSCLNKIYKKIRSESDKTENPLYQLKLEKTTIQGIELKKKVNKLPPNLRM